jgi:hypothetical protein
MKLPTPLGAVVGGGLGIAAAVLAFQAVNSTPASDPSVAQVADLSPSVVESTPAAEGSPSATKTKTPSRSVEPSPTKERQVTSPPVRQAQPASTHYESEPESGDSYEPGDD